MPRETRVQALRAQKRLWLRVCAVLLALPAFELIGHAVIIANVPRLADYRAAASFVRAQLGPRDLIAGAPGFIDPIVRWQLGDRMPLAMAGRSDDAAYERMWVLSIRGDLPSDAPRRAPSLTRQFGKVRVLRYELGPSRVLYDFTAHWAEAKAERVRNGVSEPCRLQTHGVPRGGGLGKGVIFPIRERFDCDPARPWLFIGPVVMEDLNNVPHYCLWQHAQGSEPIRLRFHDVPLGEELVFDAGIYYEHERMRTGGPVQAQIEIDGRPAGRFVHRDGDGWRSLRIRTAGMPSRADVSVAVSAPQPENRSFCWAASTRSGAQGSQP